MKQPKNKCLCPRQYRVCGRDGQASVGRRTSSMPKQCWMHTTKPQWYI